MKVRIGFVSNSSSSSFIAICPIDIDPLDELEGEEKLLAEKAFYLSKETVLEQQCKIYEGKSDEEGCHELRYAAENLQIAIPKWGDEDYWKFMNRLETIYNKVASLLDKNDKIFFKSERR